MIEVSPGRGPRSLPVGAAKAAKAVKLLAVNTEKSGWSGDARTGKVFVESAGSAAAASGGGVELSLVRHKLTSARDQAQCVLQTAPALRGDAEFILQMGDGGRPAVHRRVDLLLCDSVAKTDVHVAVIVSRPVDTQRSSNENSCQ